MFVCCAAVFGAGDGAAGVGFSRGFGAGGFVCTGVDRGCFDTGIPETARRGAGSCGADGVCLERTGADFFGVEELDSLGVARWNECGAGYAAIGVAGVAGGARSGGCCRRDGVDCPRRGLALFDPDSKWIGGSSGGEFSTCLRWFGPFTECRGAWAASPRVAHGAGGEVQQGVRSLHSSDNLGAGKCRSRWLGFAARSDHQRSGFAVGGGVRPFHVFQRPRLWRRSEGGCEPEQRPPRPGVGCCGFWIQYCGG